jgi:lantibiotic leader peptide-processing serine protease
MKRYSVLSLASLAGVLALGACADVSTPPAAVAGPSLSADAGSGRYVVEFKGNGIPSGFAAQVAGMGGTVVTSHAGAGIAVVSGLSEVAAAQLGAASGVQKVQADIEVQVLPPVEMTAAEAVADVVAESPAAPNTAFFYPRQWHLRAIGANVAWAAGKLGSASVTVAILDTGLDYLHPDLVGRVDLSRSISLVPSDDALVTANFPTRHFVTDLQYHGTHVGATVASNALAAAGVTSRTRLIGVKVLNASGSGSFGAILTGIVYAADAGADVINMSLGATFDRRDADGLIPAFNRALNYAHRQGVVVVVSAGNSAADLDHDGNSYKAFCSAPNVVCVSATGPTATAGTNGPWANVDAPAGYSNYGRSAISVAAPGGTGAGPVWEACSTSSLAIPICRTGTFIVGITGTSMASPHVAGLAALIVAEIGPNNPAQVRARLQQSADDLGQPGTDPFYGKGRINVPRALGL